MSIRTISIPWASDTSGSIHLQWDDSSITGGKRVTLPVTVTSDYNYTGEDRETLVTFRTISPTDNIVKQSHANWVAAKLNASGFDAVDSVIYIDHTLIRGKQITYRVELKGEDAQASSLGFEIKVHFTDNTDQWIARYGSSDIPDRGTFEKAYTFSSQIQDKEIEYARLYPVFRSLDGGEASGKLYVRHEYVVVGNKLPATWSPSIFDQNINLFSLSELEQGGINNGTGVPAGSNKKLRSKNFQPISGKYISVDSLNDVYKFLWLFYDKEYSYINKPVSWNWITSFPTVAEIPEGAAYVKYQITRNDNAALTPKGAKKDCLIKVGIGEERFAEKALKIIQTSDNLIIATHTDVCSIYSSNKAGIKQ